MGVVLMSGGVPVELDADRMWMFDENHSRIPNAFMGSGQLDPERVWKEQRAVRMVVGFLARNIAQVNLHAFEEKANGDHQRLPWSDPLPALLRAPGGLQGATSFESTRNLVADLCLWERHASRFVITVDGPVLRRLPPKSWKFQRDGFDQPESILARDARGDWAEQPLDGFVWFDGYPVPGEKPLQYLANLLMEEEESQAYRVQLWKRGGRMPGWIKRPAEAPPWGSKAKGKFRTGWRDYASGGPSAGNTPILEDGMEYHELEHGITPENAQQLDSRKFSLAEAAAAFYVPPVFVGLLDFTSHSNVTAYREGLYSDTLGPWFQQLQQGFNARLVGRRALAASASTFVEFNVAEKLRMNFDQQTKILQTATGGPIMTRNEARKRLNLPWIDGADDLIVPLNVITGGQASPSDSDPTKPTTGGGGTGSGGGGTGSGGGGSGGSTRALSAAETLQKVYLGVGKVVTSDEARQIVNDAGADLPIPGPDFSAPPEE